MVCLACVLIPFALIVWLKYVNPYLQRRIDEWKAQDRLANAARNAQKVEKAAQKSSILINTKQIIKDGNASDDKQTKQELPPVVELTTTVTNKVEDDDDSEIFYDQTDDYFDEENNQIEIGVLTEIAPKESNTSEQLSDTEDTYLDSCSDDFFNDCNDDVLDDTIIYSNQFHVIA